MQETSKFVRRHIGPDATAINAMLKDLNKSSLEQLVDDIIPKSIRSDIKIDLAPGCDEHTALTELKDIANKNVVFKSFIGMGYYGTKTPPVIQRNVLESPGWYTQYTPYQAEIAQGRLEALFNFQTMVADLTGLPITNASLLDEATAAAEAMILSLAMRPRSLTTKRFFTSQFVHPNTLNVLRTRAEPFEIELVTGDPALLYDDQDFFGALFQYPRSHGALTDPEAMIKHCRSHNITVTLATDLLALTLLKSPGDLGADIAIGNSQRFGVPMGFGGPHAAFFATKQEFMRRVPGRIVGLSQDRAGKPALRLALQTREQHIRRDKATSNICTSQVLLAIMSSMYAVYHGPQGLKNIGIRVSQLTGALGQVLKNSGLELASEHYFDTICVILSGEQRAQVLQRAEAEKINLRIDLPDRLCVSLDETTDVNDAMRIAAVFTGRGHEQETITSFSADAIPQPLRRKSAFLQQPVFNSYHSETLMMRYISALESRDLSLTQSMIPLGSCTMKLNAAAELMPVSWPEFSSLHPYAPSEQTKGYEILIQQLEQMLAQLTGFDVVSLQPNSGAQGEYAGLLAIRKYHQARGDAHRDICLIPSSAHGTNPASAVMAGMRVVAIKCDQSGNVDLSDLQAKSEKHKDQLAALMITYPSTHGVFEEDILEICDVIHRHGGQVYMDGANFNAQVGLCFPGEYGPDVCHLNLHKTFAIPHGGGGPGMGPIAGKAHLAEFLPSNPLTYDHTKLNLVGPVSGAHWGSASILVIPWMYVRMMGPDGLIAATQTAVLGANYMAKRLDPYYPVLYKGRNGLVAHECIIDLRSFKKRGLDVEDFAKRLMDYGFHAPTMSWPVAGTMMIEPTESESKEEMDRFCDALIQIHKEAVSVDDHQKQPNGSPIKNAPHTAMCLAETDWPYTYSRKTAAYPMPWSSAHKFWPHVRRIDNAFGDRNLVCACPPMSDYDALVDKS